MSPVKLDGTRTEKKCSRCNLILPLSMFVRDRSNKTDGLKCYCYTCARLRYRAEDLKKNYGMTIEEFDAILASQGSQCAICRVDEPGGKGAWHVDHNHLTGDLRGLLCHNCNLGLGHFQDSPDLLRKAIQYLS